MTPEELHLLETELSRCTRYLEFGAGNSTLLALGMKNIQEIDSVDSDAAYVEANLLTRDEVRQAIEARRLRIHLCHLGPTMSWGRPIDRSLRYLWPNYSLGVFNHVTQCDLVLVDGRFRVACALAASLRLNASARILIHDFTRRPPYRACLEALEEVTCAGTMGLFKIRPNLNVERITALIAHYQYFYG